jgi:hypothetical protein
MRAEPDVFMYEEREDGAFIPSLSTTNQDSNIVASFTNSDVAAADVRFKLLTDAGDEIFGYDDYTGNNVYDISGFYYDPTTNFDSSTSTATATLNIGDRTGINDPGFDLIVHYGSDDGLNFGSVIVFASGIGATTEQAVTISMQTQGSMGKSPVYRGIWNSNSDYVGLNESDGTSNASLLRGDVVHHNGTYYIAKVNNQGQQPPNSIYWDTFGAQFESVATDLLLAKDAIVSHKLTLGSQSDDSDNPEAGPNGGIINTVGKTGISSAVPGFYLSSNSSDYFGVGDASQFIRFNNLGLSINAQNFTFGGTTSNITDSSFNLNGSNANITDSSFNLGDAASYLKNSGTKVEIKTDLFYLGDGDSYFKFDANERRVEINTSFINNSSSQTINITDIQVGADPLAVFIGGGYNNSISYTKIAGSFNSLASSIVGGANNTIEGRFSFIGNGFDNDCKDNFSAIVGGYNNDMPKVSNLNQGANIIGAGQHNKIDGGSEQVVVGGGYNEISNNNTYPVLNLFPHYGDKDTFMYNVFGARPYNNFPNWYSNWVGLFFISTGSIDLPNGPDDFRGIWTSSSTYQNNDSVLHNKIFYISNQSNNTSQPGTNSNWSLHEPSSNYIFSGYETFAFLFNRFGSGTSSNWAFMFGSSYWDQGATKEGWFYTEFSGFTSIGTAGKFRWIYATESTLQSNMVYISKYDGTNPSWAHVYDDTTGVNAGKIYVYHNATNYTF